LYLAKTFFLLFFLLGTLHATDKIKIFVLHSYSEEYPWTKKQHDAFVAKLKTKRDTQFEFYTEYLDTKRVDFDKEYKNSFITYLKNKYHATPIDLIYTTDDNALEFVHEYHTSLVSKETPLFFSGVNNIAMQNQLNPLLYAGIYETKDMTPNISLIKQFSPQTRDLYILGDNSSTYGFIKEALKEKEHIFSNMHFHYVSDTYLSKIQEQLPKNKKFFAILTTIGNVKNDLNATLLPEEFIKQITEKSKIILLTMEDTYMYDGVLGGYMTSGITQGEEAAKLVLKYLETKNMKYISSMLKSPNMYIFSAPQLNKARLILSEYIARDAIIFGTKKEFLEENQTFLLNLFAILLPILLLFIIVLIIMYSKIKRSANTLQTQINKLQIKLNTKDLMRNYLLELTKSGYWIYTIKDKTLFLSQELLHKLQIDHHVYQNDNKLIHYFTHPDNQKLFDDAFHDVLTTHKTQLISHKMVTRHNQTLEVKHLLYVSYEKDTPAKIIGVIKFETNEL
jgi:hypothetical protein